MHELDHVYFDLCKRLVVGERVGNTRELRNVQITIEDIDNNIVSLRDVSPAYLAGELLWYYAARNDVQFISKFSSFWSHISDNGQTNNSAYGHLIHSGYGFNQFRLVVDMLKLDPNSRRAVINLNVPNSRAIVTKDEPCTIALQFLLRGNRLHCTGMMRSNDIWFGFPYDIVFFTDLQKCVADALEVECGTYTHFVTSMHLYDKDYDRVSEIVENPVSKPLHLDHDKFHDRGNRVVMDCIANEDHPKNKLLKFMKEKGILYYEN